MNPSRFVLKTTRQRRAAGVLGCLLACACAVGARAQFIPTGAGSYDYNTVANWSAATINGTFTQTPTAAQTVTFGKDTTLTTGLTFNLGGVSPAFGLTATGGDRTVTLGGNVSVSGNATTIGFGSGTVGQKLNVNLGGADRTFIVFGNNALTVNNGISGSYALTKVGTGQLTLAAPNTYTGTTTINAGTLTLNATNTLVSGNNVVVNSTTAGTTAQLVLGTGVSQTVGTLTFGGAGSQSSATNNVILNSGSILTLSGTVNVLDSGERTGNWGIHDIGTLNLGGNRTFAIADSAGSFNELNISTPITGTGSLIKTGAGTLSLNGSGSWTGGTVISGGELWLNATGIPSSGPVTINHTDGGARAYLRLGDNVSQSIGALTFGGAGASSSSNNELELRNGSVLTLGGTVTVNATGNPFTSRISGVGTLSLGGNRIFDIGGDSTTMTGLSVATVISGANQSITKIGTGTLKLGGANTYSGGTVVSAGGLVVSNTTGSGVGTGALVIQSGAFLRGTGIVGGATTIEAGGILGAGDFAGNLSITAGNLTFTNGLTLNDGAIFKFKLGTASDKISLIGGVLTGAATPGSLTINLDAGTGFSAGTYTLFDFSSGGTTTSSFDVADFTLGTTISGYSYNLALNGGSSMLQLTASAIPEPSTYAAIFGALALSAAGWHRRRARATRPN